MRSIALTLYVLVAATAFAQADGWPSNPTAPESLSAAHAAYLDGNLQLMFQQLRITLEEHQDDDAIRANALALLQEAYAGNRGRVPSDWKLPGDITALRLGVVRRARTDVVEYTVRLAGDMRRHGVITQLQLMRHPHEVIVDKQAGIGEWEETDGENGGVEFELSAPCMPLAIPDGLYRITMVLHDGTRTEGHIILSDVVATQAPRVLSPSPGERVAAGPLSFRWQDFRSPEYKPFEYRGLWMAVARMDPPLYDWQQQWSTYVHQPALDSVVIDRDAAGRELKLRDGRYVFVLNYSEAKHQGDISIRRQSVTTTPFHVRQRD